MLQLLIISALLTATPSTERAKIPAVQSAPSASTSISVPKNFVYFLDEFNATNIQVMPANFAVIGETNTPGNPTRSSLTSTGRVVGTQTEFYDSNNIGASIIAWTAELENLFNGPEPDLTTPANRNAFALQILVASRISGYDSGTPDHGFPLQSANEWDPTPAGGYVLYTQNIQNPTHDNDAKKIGAAITAVMWATRVYLGPNMKIIPVVDSIFVKRTAADWDLKSILQGDANDKYLTHLKLEDTLSSVDKASLLANQIDLFSLLRLASAKSQNNIFHPIINGILAEQYSTHGTMINCGAPPGSFSNDTPDFYDSNLPYAIMSAYGNPAQLFSDTNPACSTLTKPWNSYYKGSMPFLSGVYWPASVEPISTFNPSDYLTPTIKTTHSICTGDVDNSGEVDSVDLLAVIAAWGSCSGCTEDFDGNNMVDVYDLLTAINAWGECLIDEASPTWISVLIAQNSPPASNADQLAYVKKIYKLAPNLEQIHLRSKNTNNLSNLQFANLIHLFRNQYGSLLQIGFHPDNSKTSCELWECENLTTCSIMSEIDCTHVEGTYKGDNTTCTDSELCSSVLRDYSEGPREQPLTGACCISACSPANTTAWHCVLDKSIILMNTINNLVEVTYNQTGFSIFSIEQSYVENVGTSLSEIKQCLAGDSSALPNVTAANPAVKFGNVRGSYGEESIYGTNGYDYGYPQYYNLGKHLIMSPEVLDLVTNNYFAHLSTPCAQADPTTQFYVVDNNVCSGYQPSIPCFEPCSSRSELRNIFNTDPQSGLVGASPELASSYLAYLMTQYSPISDSPALGGSEVYITFSGENSEQFSFFGTNGWTLQKIADFKTKLDSNFSYLKQHASSLFPTQGSTDPSLIKYAIWNFEAILNNITLP